MEDLKRVAAVIGGLVAGVPASLYPFIMGYAIVYHYIQTVFPSLPQNPSAQQMLILTLSLYAIWACVVLLFVRSARTLKPAHLFFLVVPLPSILIVYAWQTS